jgi:hypothetical protein
VANRARFLLLLALLLPLAPGQGFAAETSQADQVRRDVTALVEAGYRGDVETVLRFAHPTLIERLGGREAARSAMEKVLREAARADVELESFSVPEGPDFLAGRERRFVVVQTLSVIRGKDGARLESLNYLLGVREHGSDRWAYVEGSLLDQQNVRALFPDFPAGYVFPRFYRRRL